MPIENEGIFPLRCLIRAFIHPDDAWIVPELNPENPNVLWDRHSPHFPSLIPDGTSDIGDTSSEISDGTFDISDVLSEVSEGTSDIGDVLSEVSDGTFDISDASSGISDGTFDISDAPSGISDGTFDISDASSGISDGTFDISDVSSEISDGFFEKYPDLFQMDFNYLPIPRLAHFVSAVRFGVPMLSNSEINRIVASYYELHPGETERGAVFRHFLATNTDYVGRTNFNGHITTSAFVLSADGQSLLLIHHVRLNRLLQPGGHFEGDENFVISALREVEEETGLPAATLELIGDGALPIDIDPHLIPANKKREEPEHYHYDLRYLFRVKEHAEIRLQLEEVSACGWFPLDGPEVEAAFSPLVRGKWQMPNAK